MKSALILSLFAVKAFADAASDKAAADQAAVGPMLGNFAVTIADADKAACCVPDGKIILTQATNKKNGATAADKIINLKANWTTTATEAASNQCTILGLVDTAKSAPVQGIFTDGTQASWNNFAKADANWFKIRDWTPKPAENTAAVQQTVGLTITKNTDFTITQDFTKKEQTTAWSADFKFTTQNAGAAKTDGCHYIVKASKTGKIFCPDGQYVGDTACTPCPEHCTACTGPNECTKCAAGFGLPDSTSDKKCQTCPDGTWANPKTSKCQQCFGQCAKCKSDTECLECKGNQELVAGKCKKCKENQFFAEKKCHDCGANCAKCTDAKTCQKCTKGYGLNNGACETCKANQFVEEKESKCVDCPSGCTKCNDAKKCTECEKEGYDLKDDQCVKKAGSSSGSSWGWAILIIVLIAIAGGVGYYFYSQQKAKKLNEALIASHD